MDGHALPRDSVFFEHPLETLILGSVLETLSFTSPSHGGGQEFESPRAHPCFSVMEEVKRHGLTLAPGNKSILAPGAYLVCQSSNSRLSSPLREVL